jgi:16S rRNA (guanine527-N7)-methyltransferase
MIEIFNNILTSVADEAGLVLSKGSIRQFSLYFTELLEWNARINLTTITEPEDAAIKHFLDSILISSYVPLSGSFIDIGSGAGFPGLPLKIVQPELHIVLVESIRKKANFLKQIIRLLKLDGVEVYNGRIEDFNCPEFFDYAASRAFSELELFCRLAAPFVKSAGMLIAMKGKEKTGITEGQREPVSGCTCTAVHTYSLPRRKGERSLVLLQKCFT